jgi:hypothetical protein
MAARFWVTGGTGNWNDTSNWSATSGGASGASVPGSADTATLDASSGAGTVTLDISPTIQTLTCTGFTGTLAFGTNTISLNSTGTIFTGATTMTVTGTPLIICTNSSATARTILPGTGITEANSISFRVTAGTGTFTISTTPTVRDLDFTDGVNPTGFAGSLTMAPITIYGNFKASTGMTHSSSGNVTTFAATSGVKTINTAGVTFDRPFTFNGVGGTFQLAAALTSGATRTATLTAGTLDLAGYTLTTGLFNSNNSNVRTLAFGTGKIVLTSTTGTVLSMSTATNFTYTGTSRIEVTASGAGRTITPVSTNAVESNVLNIYVTTGSDTLTVSGAARFLDFDLTGFTGTLTYSSSTRYFGNLTFSSGMTLGTVASTMVFAKTSGTQTITSAGKTIEAGVTIDAPGATVSLQDALTLGSTRTLTLTNGTLQLQAGTTSTVGSFATSGTNQKYLESTTPGTRATISDPSGTVTVTYLTIKDIAATGGATWDANASTNFNTSNNSGWNFSSAIGNGWGLGGWGLGEWGYGQGAVAYGDVGTVGSTVSIALTGVVASGNVDSVATSRTKALTGVLGRGAVGSVTETQSIGLSGVSASGAVGSVTETNNPTEDGTVAIGNAGTVTALQAVSLSGVAGSGAVGTLGFGKAFPLTGDVADGAAGLVSTSRTVALSGVSASGIANTVVATTTKALTGVAGSGFARSVTTRRTKALTGVAARGAVNAVIVPLLPINATGNVGTVSVDREIALTGVASSAAVGSMALGPRVLSLTGNLASGFTGDVIAVYWKLIDDSETANWQNIDNSQTSNWNTVATVQTADWEEIVT